MIQDLIKSYSGDATTVTAFSVGSFALDAQLDEAHESNLITTENAMESGALSSDHSYLEPKRFAVRGIMVSYEPFNIVNDLMPVRYSFIKDLPLPLGIEALGAQAVAVVNRYASTALNALDTVKKFAKPLAPWLPDSLGWLGDEATTSNRFEKVYSDLLSIQKSGELLVVTSGLMTYQNMQLVNVAATKGTDDAIDLALTFKEVHIVETRTVQGLVVNVPTPSSTAKSKTDGTTSKTDGAKKSGRAADQAAKPKAKGKTQPTQQSAPKKSIATSIGDVIRGGL